MCLRHQIYEEAVDRLQFTLQSKFYDILHFVLLQNMNSCVNRSSYTVHTDIFIIALVPQMCTHYFHLNGVHCLKMGSNMFD